MEVSTKPAASIRKRKLRQRGKQIRHAKNPNSLFPLALAALLNPENPSSTLLIKECLNKFHHRMLLLQSMDSTFRTSNELLLTSILALLPLLLKSRCTEIESTSLKILGGASLLSYKMNERIVLEEGETLRLLLPKVLFGEREVAMVACNAVLDISTTSLGRGKLLEFSALNYLMLGFVQVMKSSTSLSSLCVIKKEAVAYLGVEILEDELPVMLLDTLVFLVNSCNMEQLEHLPRKLTQESVRYMKRPWGKLREQVLCGEFKKISCGRKSYMSNVAANNFSEAIFRLSLNENFLDCGISSDIILKCIFGADKSGFADFISSHWESSPLLVRSTSSNLQHDIFGQFMQSLNVGMTIPLCLSSLLRGMVSCPPIASNEMDILEFLKEVKSLACPIIYQQDIRVLRTEPHLQTERHFRRTISNDGEIKMPFNMHDVIKCEEAFKEGYTVALRGMEFRMKNIGAFADELASIFGQPSAGANLYLTPPNSQGLACHYDDHCVFVCQLHGSKLWTVYSEPFFHLPRLYDSLKDVPDLLAGSRDILLHEGDVLYIPRGFPHKACTFLGSNEVSSSDDFSLHLTFGVEIEPPFEWEGFMHLALHQWSHNYQRLSNDVSKSCLPAHMDNFSLNLLHVSIKLISSTDSTFRKACMVAAAGSFSSAAPDVCFDQQQVIFNQLIEKIHELNNFPDSLHYTRESVQRTDEPFPWMRWLYILDDEQTSRHECIMPVEEIEEFLTSIDGRNHDKAASAYTTIKSKFCEEVSFDDVRERYKMLHSAFRKVRKQYMNGMLSLHF